ncbi:threonine--tRNA ligase [Candidatus Peregrinibacteria bacterium]|nr:threonine--tRNA ligase [Candidatus Peregrinibacteria bacterium]
MSKKEIPISTKRHSLSHIMAQAVLEMFPEASLAIGPDIDTGFYYDFQLPRTLIPEDLPIIEKKMKHIIKQNQKFESYIEPVDKAIEFLKKTKQDFKVELVADLKAEGVKEVSFYKNGNFVDLCKGPHVEMTGQIQIGTFKLDKIAGAYWRGDEKRPMLQRIYGLAFDTKEDLDEFFRIRKEAEKRDHRKLGRELDLFSTHQEAGPGLIYWHPKGARIRHEIESFWRDEHLKNGYELVYSPHVGKSWLWETSGHLDFYKEGMFPEMKMDGDDYYVKPMNCPFHVLMYNNTSRSYRDLPMRWAELGTVYRYEASGVLHGLLRVRGFTQDDAHIICTPDQIEDEIVEVIRFSMFMWRAFGFKDIKAYISTKPEKSVGDEKKWKQATESLTRAVKKEGIEVEIDEGGGAFYGPKIDLKIRDAIGREWQTSTIQFDFNLPERFNMTYIGEDGKEKQPYMVHRALLGSIERFFGILIEHFGGAFPVWLAPVQVVVVPVASVHQKYAEDLKNEMFKSGIRVEIMSADETLGKRIREAEKNKIPYMLVVGDDEVKSKSVNVRSFHTKEQKSMKTDKFIKEVVEEIKERKLP